MLFQILKLFGLDIPAKIDALKASFELRVEQVTDHAKQVAQEAAVIAALSAFATLTGVTAVSVGLLALYRWTAAAYGADAGRRRGRPSGGGDLKRRHPMNVIPVIIYAAELAIAAIILF